MIANNNGKMVVGQFGSFIDGFLTTYQGEIEEGDVLVDGVVEGTIGWGDQLLGELAEGAYDVTLDADVQVDSLDTPVDDQHRVLGQHLVGGPEGPRPEHDLDPAHRMPGSAD